MENSLATKQQYLSKEILIKGYNSNDFLVFLKSKKENGDNLDKLSMSELRQYVTEFQLIVKQSIISPQEKYKSPIKNSIIIRGSALPANKSILSCTESQIQCVCQDLTDFSEVDDMRLMLSFPEKKKENSGRGKKFVISFIIEVKPVNIKVRRNLDDFIWLRNIMRKLFPGSYIPPINKKAIEESTKDSKIEKRMKNYERFLNSITQDQLLKSSRIFYDFLTTFKETEFQLKMKAYDNKLVMPKSISQIQSINGVIELNTNIINNTSFWNKTSEYIQFNVILLKKLHQTYKLLLTEMNQVSIRFNELSSIYNEIATLSSKSINNNTNNLRKSAYKCDTNNSSLMKTYKEMENLMIDLSYFLKKQSAIFDLDINQHIKYLVKEYSVFKELKDDFINYKVNYDKSIEKLDKKKDDLFKKKEIKKWGLKAEDTNIDPNNKDQAYEKMLPEETQELNELRLYCYYLGSSYEEELKRIENLIERQNNETLNEIYDKIRIILRELNDSLETPRV